MRAFFHLLAATLASTAIACFGEDECESIAASRRSLRHPRLELLEDKSGAQSQA